LGIRPPQGLISICEEKGELSNGDDVPQGTVILPDYYITCILLYILVDAVQSTVLYFPNPTLYACDQLPLLSSQEANKSFSE